MQQQSNSILIIAAPPVHDTLQRALSSFGYQTVVASTGNQGLRIANEQGAVLAVVTYKLPDMIGLDVANGLETLCPAILLSTPQQKEWAGVLGRRILSLTAPIKAEPLRQAVELCLSQVVTPPYKPPPRSKPEQALVERAKRLLMATHQIDEPAAHKQMQRMSMDSGKPLLEVARIVLEML